MLYGSLLTDFADSAAMHWTHLRVILRMGSNSPQDITFGCLGVVLSVGYNVTVLGHVCVVALFIKSFPLSSRHYILFIKQYHRFFWFILPLCKLPLRSTKTPKWQKTNDALEYIQKFAHWNLCKTNGPRVLCRLLSLAKRQAPLILLSVVDGG